MLPVFTLSSRLSSSPRPLRQRGLVAVARCRWVRSLEAISLWLAMLMLMFIQPLYAEAAISERGDGAGAFYFVSPGNGAQGEAWEAPATILTTDYQVTVSGLIATTRLVQTFANTSQQWREGVFVFPLPEDASVYGLTMRAGERITVGEIREREAARKQYEAAKKQGQQVAKVEQQRPNLFTTRLANIPPGETVAVELNYQQTVRYQSGEFELRLPTTVTPRYMPGRPVTAVSQAWQSGWATPTSAVPDADQISPFTVTPAEVAAGSHRAVIRLNLNMGLSIATVTSPSHPLTNTWNGDEVTVVPASGSIVMDRDLVVRWSPERGQAPSAAVFRERWQDEDYLLTLLVPGMDSQQRLPRELIFVIDTSGSMAGESIRQARASLLQGLETLSDADRFNVIEFNSQTHALFMDAQPVNSVNLARARQFVTVLEADGGTELSAALTAALQPEATTEVPAGTVRQVVFITDGAVGNGRALFRQIEQQLGDSRLFTVGIGSAPNMHFMREAARYGRGTYTAINDIRAMNEPLDELFRKMQAPVLADIEVDWPASSGADALPRRSGDLFLGEPLVQVARGQFANDALAEPVALSGRLPDGSRWQSEIRLANAADGAGLHRYWAQQKIDSLRDQSLTGEPENETKIAITELGLKHELLTPYTSFIAVDKTPVRSAAEPLATDAVPTLLPAGSAPHMLRYPQTATWSPLIMAIGLLGFMFSAAALMVKRRVMV